MGWTNFIIVPKLKLIVQTHREVSRLNGYISDGLSSLIEGLDEEIVESILERNYKKFTLNDLSILVEVFKSVYSLGNISIDYLLLYWLENRGIDYSIVTEFELDEGEELKYREEGYTIIKS